MDTAISPIDFEDTSLAFRAKSDKQLRRTYQLFQLIDNPFLTKIGPKLILSSFKLGLPLEGLVRSTIFELFCGGESIPETVSTSEMLNKYGVKTIMDYSIESEKNEEGFEKTLKEILDTLKHGSEHSEVKFSAIKLTSLASFSLMEKIQAKLKLSEDEKQKLERVYARVEKICEAARNYNTSILIDAEESWIQDTIDGIAESFMQRYNTDKVYVFTTIQLYRNDKLAYLKQLVEDSKNKNYTLGVKLVRGAYLEKENKRAESMGYPTPMQPNLESTHRDFNEALSFCIQNLDHLNVISGTHNEASSKYLIELMNQHQIAPDDPRVWSSQLLGMSDHISFNMADKGYNIAKYLPYGPVKAALPYLMRRAQENTAIAGQSGRELQLLRKEMKRRKLL